MKILFVHQGFPAQFKHLAPALAADPGNHVVALHQQAEIAPLAGVEQIRYPLQRSNSPDSHPWLQNTETKIIRGEAVWQAAQQLKAQGFYPDVMVAHPGWGEALFLKDVWPQARLLIYTEFYYHAEGADNGFDAEFPVSAEAPCLLRLKNITNLLMLESCDAALSPMHWQKSL